ncbi:tumor necrosis factor receptor superfamily member 5 isoform X2 [Anguilla anguilla]|uniref:tumor necrosis factor receptor superfamily member 5 isoform X2 n=1 Tax=Anguilla anguilla TaxID=7936 RepID=UPI0015B16E64|nr:tumor necrosis factor receptor superfamily member 5 isoform X2 [Anguilla anguilla]
MDASIRLLCCLTWFCICLKFLSGAPNLCPPGQMKNYGTGNCVPCPDYAFQSTPNNGISCKNCRTCEEALGSEFISKCTSTADAECRCREGFVAREKDQSSCKCDRGSELDETVKKCLRCPHGKFNNIAGKKCEDWTNCGTRGVRKPGSHTSDVECRDDPGNNRTSNPQDPSSVSGLDNKKHVTLSAAVAMTSPQTTASASPSVTPPTTASTSASVSLSADTPPVSKPGFPGYAIAVPPILLLILLSPVICKHLIVPFIQNYKKKTLPVADPWKRAETAAAPR